jgi:hypothetical protein
MNKLPNESYGDYFQRIGDMDNKTIPTKTENTINIESEIGLDLTWELEPNIDKLHTT